MKFSTFITLLLLGCGIWYMCRSPLGPWLVDAMRSSLKERPDPSRELKKMADNLPRQITASQFVKEVSTYVKKSDNPYFQYTGYLSFNATYRYELVFLWDTDHWVFLKLMSRDSEKDITHEPEGRDILENPEMVSFIAVSTTPPVTNPAENPLTATAAPASGAAPAQAAPFVPRRTPSPQEKALEIARKYGSSK